MFNSGRVKKLLVLAAATFAMLITFTGCGYNGLVDGRESVEKAWADVEAQYQRRNDLIPNLVSTVKGFAAHEENVYKEISDARAKLGSMVIDSSITEDPEKLQQFQEVQGQLSSSLSRLLAVTENYPELKSNENFLDLQSQLEGTENRIATARTRYNSAVESYNKSISRFPTNITANMFHFERKQYFKADVQAAKAPEVSF